MVHQFETYFGPDHSNHEWSYKDQNGKEIDVKLNLTFVYAQKMFKCVSCGLMIVEQQEPKFKTCEEVLVDELMEL